MSLSQILKWHSPVVSHHPLRVGIELAGQLKIYICLTHTRFSPCRFLHNEGTVWRCVLQLTDGCTGQMVWNEKTHLQLQSLLSFHFNTVAVIRINRYIIISFHFARFWHNEVCKVEQDFFKEPKNINFHSFLRQQVDYREATSPTLNEIQAVKCF